MADRVGQQLGNYRLSRLIGQGGFADVYLGEHTYLKTQAAIKVLQTRVTDDELQAFLKEAQTIASLQHPHIVRVFDFGVQDEIPFLVMDYAPDGTLRKLHPRGTQLPLTTISWYTKQIAEALQYAHDHKFIHRDIKPDNMLLGRRNEVLLSDFGIALLAQSSRSQDTHQMAGTVSYMAPEQIQGKPRPASDQYSLGIVVYEWLSGDRPFHGSMTAIATQQILAPPPPLHQKVPTILPAIEEVVMIALAKDPVHRFTSVQSFATALEQACRSEPLASPVPLSGPAQLSTPAGEPSVTTPQPLLPKPSEIALPSHASERAAPSSPRLQELPQVSKSPPDEVSPTTKEPYANNTVTERPDKRAKVWSFGISQVVATVLGVILYGGLNYFLDSLYKIDSPLVVTSLFILNNNIDKGIILAGLILIIPLFLATTFGPAVGLLTVGAGLYLGSLFVGYDAGTSYYGASWTWLVGRVLIGVIAGLAVFLTRGRYNTGRAIAIAVASSAIAIIIGTAFTAYVDIWVSGIATDVAGTTFSKLTLPCIIDLILLPILLVIYNTIVERRKRV
jgi:serine/threonine protein kinase